MKYSFYSSLRSTIVPWLCYSITFSLSTFYLFFSSEYVRMWCKTVFQPVIKVPMLLLAKTSHVGSAWECSLILAASHVHLPLGTCILHRYRPFQTLYSFVFFFFVSDCQISLLKGFCKAFDVNIVTLIK